MEKKNKYNRILIGLFSLFVVVIGISACSEEEQVSPKSYVNPNIDLQSIGDIREGITLSIWLDVIKENGGKFIITIEGNKLVVKKYQNNTKADTPPPDYWDTDKGAFYKWVDEVLESGKGVIITYDRETGAYFGWIIEVE